MGITWKRKSNFEVIRHVYNRAVISGTLKSATCFLLHPIFGKNDSLSLIFEKSKGHVNGETCVSNR